MALDASELERLRELERRAKANGVPGVRWVERDELRELEPHAAGIAGVHSPTTAITDYVAIAHALAADVRAANGEILLSAEVTAIRRIGARARVETGGQPASSTVSSSAPGCNRTGSHDLPATSESRGSSRFAGSTTG